MSGVVREYKVVQTRTAEALQNSVQIEVNKGWQPLGAPFMSYDDKNVSQKFYQAIVKYYG